MTKETKDIYSVRIAEHFVNNFLKPRLEELKAKTLNHCKIGTIDNDRGIFTWKFEDGTAPALGSFLLNTRYLQKFCYSWMNNIGRLEAHRVNDILGGGYSIDAEYNKNNGTYTWYITKNT